MTAKFASIWQFIFIFAATTLMGASCTTGSTGGQVVGNYITLDQHCYPAFDPYLLNNLDVPALATDFAQRNWKRTEALEDSGVPSGCQGSDSPIILASNFTDSQSKNADFIYFSGHGNGGVIALYSYVPPMPGSTESGEDFCKSNQNQTCFDGLSAGLPSSGRAKWIAAYASQDTADLNWTNLFNQSTSGIHGYYGVEFEPTDTAGTNVANKFTQNALGNDGVSGYDIHDAWQNAIVTYATTLFGEWDLADAQQDVLTSGSTSSGIFSDSNPVYYTNTSGTYTFQPSLQSLNSSSPGAYQPYALTTESYSDSTLLSDANSAEGTAVASQPSSNEYHIQSTTFSGSHYEASQGIVEGGVHSTAPYNYTQAQAEAYAVQFMQNQGAPLPSDAQLQAVSEVTKTQGGQSSAVVMGYIFTWVHSNMALGGDYIRVGVDNFKSMYCSEPNPNDPPHNKPLCLQYSYNYNQHVNVFYRLWRQRNSTTRSTLGAGSPALSSQQAYNIAAPATAGKGNLGTYMGYLYSYYMPSIDSTDNTAYPAYHFFYSNHAVVSVDAYSGTILGMTGGIN